MCRGPAGDAGAVCFGCRVVGRRLGLPLAPVLPARLCPVPGPLYTVLLGYKESAVREARDRFAPLVRALVGAFLCTHAPCVSAAAGGPIDVVAPVPSSRRPSGAPLARLDGLGTAVCAPFPGARWEPRLLTRGRGSADHLRPDPAVFTVAVPARAALRGRRVLLLDDTYVSGARAQSAAAALRQAGARVVIVPAGRALRPARVPRHAAFLRALHEGGGSRPVAVGADSGAAGTGIGWCWRCVQRSAATE